MNISVEELINKIKEIFSSTKVLSVDSTYEKNEDSDELKLIISINKILYDDVNIIYTKLIFITNIDKSKIVKNYFTYLFDINCEYVRVDFSTLEDLSTKISNIFNKNKFGENIKILSKFIKSPSTLINKWLEENKISRISVVNVEETKIDIMPCNFLFFNFVLDISNTQTVDLTISKEGEKEYIFKFKFLNNIYEESQINLNKLVETIGEKLKKIIKI